MLQQTENMQIVNSQIHDNLSSSPCHFLTDKARTTSNVSFERYFAELQDGHRFFYSFSQSKVDRISFPKFTIFYATKVSKNLGRNWVRMGPKGEEAPRMSNIGRWGTYVQIPTGPKS